MGAGSGVLAIFAAKAGAKRVYAVEATDMAKFARKVVQHNKVGPRGPANALMLSCQRHRAHLDTLARMTQVSEGCCA